MAKNNIIKGKDPIEKKEIVLSGECELDTSKYRTKDNNNRFLTAEMFFDHPDNNMRYNRVAPYSLYNHEDVVLTDGTLIRSMRKIFLDLNDSSGYQCAIKTLGCKEHWDRLLASNKIGDEIAKWVEELQLKELSLIKKVCLNELSTVGKNAMQAAKIIISLNNQDPNSLTNRDKAVMETRSKEKNKQAEPDASLMQDQQQRLMEDFKRLNS